MTVTPLVYLPDDSRPMLILGTGLFAVEIAAMAVEIPGVAVVGFVESLDRARCAVPLDGKPVYWVDDLGALASTHRVVCGLGTTHRRRFVEQAAAQSCEFVTLVHPSARVPASDTLGPGTVIHAGAVLAAHTHLGAHVLVNRAANLGHHTRVGDFVTIGPGVNLAGSCTLGPAVYVGIGATIVDHVTIGAQAVVGAGAVVTQDVPERVLVVGVPARIVKRDIDGM